MNILVLSRYGGSGVGLASVLEEEKHNVMLFSPSGGNVDSWRPLLKVAELVISDNTYFGRKQAAFIDKLTIGCSPELDEIIRLSPIIMHQNGIGTLPKTMLPRVAWGFFSGDAFIGPLLDAEGLAIKGSNPVHEIFRVLVEDLKVVGYTGPICLVYARRRKAIFLIDISSDMGYIFLVKACRNSNLLVGDTLLELAEGRISTLPLKKRNWWNRG
jgi:hypothetical protein